MKEVRKEIDQCNGTLNAQSVSLQDLRKRGEKNHYKKFRWPQPSEDTNEHQLNAKSWIARQRLHLFWEAIPLLVALIGLLLIGAILSKWFYGQPGVPSMHPPQVTQH